MKTLLFEAAKIVLCSGVLWGAYELLLDRRAPLSWCRRYLLLLPPVASLIPFLRIPLLPAPAIEPAVFEELPLTEEIPVAASSSAALPLPETIAIVLWAVGALVLLGAMLRQIRIIRRLRRNAAISQAGRYRLALTREQIAPFSFCGTIYLWVRTTAEERRAIVAHEMSHLQRHHSAERILMEGMKALLWWNPFIWFATRRLAEAQEYEADRAVLTAGYDLESYMHILFRQLFGYSPDIASGLRDSLTKKRFQMMTIRSSGRYALLRLAGSMLAATSLLCAFSLTSRAAEIRIAEPATVRNAVADPIYMFNGVETSKEAIFAPDGQLREWVDRSGTQAEKDAARIRIRNLTGEEALQKYGEKGRNGVIEITAYHEPANRSETKDARPAPAVGETTVPEVAVVKYGTAKPSDDEPMLITEKMPEFQGGGLLQFRAWVQQRLRYPQTETQGRVVATFVIDRDGSLGSIEVLESPDEALTQEALRILGSVPSGAWTPGRNKEGKPVQVRYTLPIDFRIMTSEPSEPAGK
ncbi:MAG: M56 family metallopeptidase [Alistipes sp.]|nr:M56 family metallopeptidase [Alistipes senegalensis]MCM1249699.1 M56 family metallopeptidase [Alistipes sp.]